jgi:hypothetical protein
VGFEFTRINIELTILRKKIEELREAQRCCRSVPTVPRSARSLLDP